MKSKRLREEAFKSHPKMGTGKKIVLFLPILMSVSWILYLRFGVQVYGGRGELLSPATSVPLIIALIIFTVGYLLFLLLMFSENVERFLWRILRH